VLRVRQDGGEHGAIGAREAACGLVEESLRGGFRAVSTVAELRDIQVHLQNAPLGPQALDQDREVGFEALAKIAASGPEEEILCDLLADGAGPPHFMAVLVERIGLFDGRHIEAPMLRKLLILRRHDGERQIGRDFIQSHPAVTEVVAGAALHPRRDLRLGHECGVGWIDPTQRGDGHDARQDANHDQP